jgi:hypothetical protein
MLTSFPEPNHVVDRKAHNKRMEKKATAAEIEADPLANDDTPAREDPPEWFSPTYTGGMSDPVCLPAMRDSEHFVCR